DAAPAVVIGKDGGYIAWDIFSEYADKGSIILKEIVLHTIDALLGEDKTLTTNLPSAGVVTLNEQAKQNRYVLHALYATPVKRGGGIEIIEDLVPVYDTTFEVKTAKPITRVTAVPQNKELPFTYENGVCKFTIDKFTCAQIVTLEY
ncbi:MAG: beta-galactosidase, partial [Clostridia bacterium]|nr:beta-galactosidase [Clostridia bacterium]